MLRFTKIWFFLLLLAQGLSAQDFYLQDSSYNKYRLPSIVIGPAFTSYKGDYNSKDIFFNANFNKGLSVACEYRVKDFLGVSLTGVFSKLTQNEKDIPSRNFRTNLLEISARGIFYLDNNITMKRGMGLSTFLFVGAGIMSHNAMGDLKDSQGRSYFYWKDGTVRDQAYDPENPLGGTIIQRDYEYETVLDTSNSVSNMSMVIPVGLGLKFKVSDRIETNVMLSYQFTGTDYLDFYHPEQDKGIFKGNDGYWNCMITIQYNLGGKAFMSDEDVHYQNVDFAVLETDNDEDGDGVEDIKDKCAGTPQGVAVDSKGCPPDSDNDGIPDYEDKEPNSVAGAQVDNYGVTITEQMMYEYYVRDSLLTAGYYPEDMKKPEGDNKNPYSYLDKDTQAENKTGNQGNGTNYTKPNLTAGEEFFSVQVSSSANRVEDEYFFKNFNIKDKVYVSEVNGLYKYYIGKFKTKQEADDFLYNIKNNYYLDNSFVSSVNSNQISQEMVVSEQFISDYLAQKAAKSNKVPEIKEISADQSGLVYRVQISSRAVKLPPEFFLEKYNISDEVFESFQDGAYKYSIGRFKTYKQARDYNIEFQNQYNLKGTYVTPYNNGLRITVQEALKIQQE